jgi:NADH-quinone oxidoreductase subunit N
VRYLVQPILGISGIASMFVGTLGALQQTKIIRFIAYASINQVGYLLLGMASCSLLGLCSSLLFIFIYAIMSLVFFRIILNIERSSNKMSLTYLSQLMHYS